MLGTSAPTHQEVPLRSLPPSLGRRAILAPAVQGQGRAGGRRLSAWGISSMAGKRATLKILGS